MKIRPEYRYDEYYMVIRHESACSCSRLAISACFEEVFGMGGRKSQWRGDEWPDAGGLRRISGYLRRGGASEQADRSGRGIIGFNRLGEQTRPCTADASSFLWPGLGSETTHKQVGLIKGPPVYARYDTKANLILRPSLWAPIRQTPHPFEVSKPPVHAERAVWGG